MKNINFDNYSIERLKDSKVAESMLNIAVEEYIEDGDTKHFLNVLKDIIKAQDNISKIALEAGVGRQNMYKILSGSQDPRMSTILKIIHAMGFSLSFRKIKNSQPL